MVEEVPLRERADRDLMAQHCAGDPEAFGELFRRHRDRMWAVALRTTGNREVASDCLQEAFIAAFRRADSYRGDAAVTTWLHRIVVNSALMRLRSRRSRPEVSIEALLPSFREDGHHLEPPTAWEEGAPEQLLAKERGALVRAAIESLPDTHREVLLLRDIEGLSTEATARLLDVTTNAVKIRLHRARLALRTLLDRHFQGSSS